MYMNKHANEGVAGQWLIYLGVHAKLESEAGLWIIYLGFHAQLESLADL